MNCKRCHKKLIQYLEESLQVSERQEVEQHLLECASCHGFADYLKETLATIESSRITTPDPFFYTRVKAKLEKQEESFHARPVFARILQPAMFTLILIAAIYAGLKIGDYALSSDKENYVVENLDPWMNELNAEPLETFLMEQ
jgi:hypothetical protein